MHSSRVVTFHVGLHKTGTTSIQSFMHVARAELCECGVDYYLGSPIAQNHVELHLAALRFERLSGFKQRQSVVVDDRMRAAITNHVNDHIRRSPCRRVVFSNEGLSLLRFPDEMERLRAMTADARIEIVFYRRKTRDYLRSYSAELHKDPATLPAVIDKDSFAYTEPDSWLADIDARIDAFRSAFGTDNVIVLDYDREIESRGNVIPSFLETLGVESSFREELWKSMFLNRSVAAPKPAGAR